MQEGTPITFRMQRRSKRSKLPMYSSNGEHLGVFVSSFSTRIIAKHSWQSNYVEEKARVYSPYSKQLHTCEMNTTYTLDGRRFDPNSIIGLHWEALAKTMPIELVVTDQFTTQRIHNIQFRSRSTHLIDVLPRDWPKNTEFRKTIESWTQRPCWITNATSHNDENVVGYEGCMINANSDSATVLRRTEAIWRTEGWLYYDPASREQRWQTEARRLLTEMMRRYETSKRKRFKKEETT